MRPKPMECATKSSSFVAAALLAVVLALAAFAKGATYRAPVIIPIPERACQKAWYQAVDGGTSLPYHKASPYIEDLKSADPDNDGVFTKSEFVNACKRGFVRLL